MDSSDISGIRCRIDCSSAKIHRIVDSIGSVHPNLNLQCHPTQTSELFPHSKHLAHPNNTDQPLHSGCLSERRYY